MAESLYGFNFSTEDERGAKYLALSPAGAENFSIIQYQVEMLLNNKIPGLLNLNVRRKDDHIKLFYSLEDYMPLNSYLKKKKVSKNDFINLLNRILTILSESNNYFLNQESFILIDRYIYVKNDFKDVSLLYIPADFEQDAGSSLKNLVITLIAYSPGIDARDTQMGDFLNYLKQENITLKELHRYIKQLCFEKEPAPPAYSPAPDPGQLPPKPAGHQLPPVQHDIPPVKQSKHKVPVKGKKSDKPKASPKKTAEGKKETAKASGEKNPGNTNIRTVVLGIIALIVVGAVVLREQSPDVLTYFDSYLYIALGAALIAVSVGIIIFIYLRTKKEKEVNEVRAVDDRLLEIERIAVGPQLAAAAENRVSTPVREVYQPKEVFNKEVLNKEDDEDTSLMDDSDETQLFEDCKTVLKTEKLGKEVAITINKPEFYIGRNQAVVDYAESDNKNIGRVHAKIILKDSNYFIVDLDSKNGTFLNGEKLGSNKPYPLKFKDKIRLANVEYLFDEVR